MQNAPRPAPPRPAPPRLRQRARRSVTHMPPAPACHSLRAFRHRPHFPSLSLAPPHCQQQITNPYYFTAESRVGGRETYRTDFPKQKIPKSPEESATSTGIWKFQSSLQVHRYTDCPPGGVGVVDWGDFRYLVNAAVVRERAEPAPATCPN